MRDKFKRSFLAYFYFSPTLINPWFYMRVLKIGRSLKNQRLSIRILLAWWVQRRRRLTGLCLYCMDKDEAHSTTGGFTGKAAWIPCRGLSCFPYQPFLKDFI
ncbi:hypothetical protein [Desulfosarcina variabilis]|uniref:hypothetical protein n=1 Tax=Desulfosarcina variabilis TaxID=2300 RepID=UPI003AFB633B